MRKRNFLIQMGFSLFVAILLVVFVHNVPLAILYVVGHLIWALSNDRKTARSENTIASLKAKYPEVAKPDTDYVIDGKTVTLKDSFVKSSLLDTIAFLKFSSKNKKENELIERFFSSVMAGNYQLQQHIVSDKELVTGNDSPNTYFIACGSERFEILHSAYLLCETGDSVVSVSVQGLAAGVSVHSLLIWLDPMNNKHQIAWKNNLFQIGIL